MILIETKFMYYECLQMRFELPRRGVGVHVRRVRIVRLIAVGACRAGAVAIPQPVDPCHQPKVDGVVPHS